MDFSLKPPHSLAARLGKTAVLLTGLSVLVLMSGCTEQHAKINSRSAVLTEPVVNERLTQEDFAFPAQAPSLKRGREVFQQSCAQCHAQGTWQTPKVKEDVAYSTPIDAYLMLTTGKAPDMEMATAQRQARLPKNHPGFKDKLNREDRWAVIFYTRYLAGAGDIRKPNDKAPEIAAIFGGNCAVCHGTRGQADGPLHTSKTGNHELHNGELVNALMPAPANFTQRSRLYNRTDAQLFKYICQGIYPSAMPSWYGNVERDKDTGAVVYVFDDKVIWNLVRHVRSFSYNNDLPENLPEAMTPPPGLEKLQPCQPVANNRPWTQVMRTSVPAGEPAYKPQPGNPITGGMVLGPESNSQPVIHKELNYDQSTTKGAH